MSYDEWRDTYSKRGMFNEAMASAAWQAATATERERCAAACVHFANGGLDLTAAEALRDVAEMLRSTESYAA